MSEFNNIPQQEEQEAKEQGQLYQDQASQNYQSQNYQNQAFQNYQGQPYQNQNYQGQPYQDQAYQNYQSQGYQNQAYQNYQSQGYQDPYQQNTNKNPYSKGYDPYNAAYRQGTQPNTEPAKAKGLGVRILCIVLACAIVFGSLGYGISYYLMSKRGNRQDASINNSSSITETIPDNTQESSAITDSSAITARNEMFANSSLALSLSDNSEEAMTIPDIVKKTADSVVEITTEYVTTSYTLQQYISSGAGSGVIITSDGYIITNNHVIDGATQITVTLRNGETYPAQLVGLDEDLDIALIKIEAINLTVASIGTSGDLVVGQSIIAIGNPLGQLGGSVTSGIISALDRSITVEGKTMQLMQIDASINPGNSGGALFDEQGTLVGIVNAKSTGDNVEGIGFAIPIDNVIPILNDLQQYGYVKGRVSLGITMIDITTDQMAWMYRVNDLGVYLYSVNVGSSAEKAGLKAGDRIVKVDGTTISSSADVKKIVQSHKVGDVLSFEVVRNGSHQTISVTVGEYIPSGILNNQTLQ